MPMQKVKNAGCRTFQFVFHYGALCLPWRKAVRVEGAGAIQKIPGLLDREGAKHPMVVTDSGLMTAGVAPAVLQVLEDAAVPYALYDTVAPNPTIALVEEIFAAYQREGCDSFVAIGGGSSMDAAKAAAARVARPGKSIRQMSGLLRVGRKLPPFLAVPTTAGTGSETTIAALITDEQNHHKAAMMDLHLIPKYAILDPLLTVGLPPHITAATGMDALTHAIEAYLCWTYNTKESLRFAEEAVSIIFANLERAYTDGKDVAARMNMLTASYLAGFAFTRAGVGNVHAIAHTLGGLYNTPHGLANAVILPVVLEDYGPAVWPKLARLAELAGVQQDGSVEEKANAFLQAIRDMNRRMGIPTGFDFIREEDIPQMVAWASAEANPLYPVPVLFSPDRYRAVIERIRI